MDAEKSTITNLGPDSRLQIIRIYHPNEELLDITRICRLMCCLFLIIDEI
jgi:hypothetical protein